MKRFWEVDALRGLAVIAMIAFHFLFDLNYFAGYHFSIDFGILLLFGRFASVTFVFLAGLALTLSYNKAAIHMGRKDLFKKYLFRGLKIFGLGLIITAITYFFFPQEFIVFGVLHLIGISIILAFPLICRPKLAAKLGILILVMGIILGGFTAGFPWLVWLGLRPHNFVSFDYFPLLPWFGVMLLGLAAGHNLYPNGKRDFKLPNLNNSLVARFLSFLGRHSLAIYFIHQPILVGLIFFLM